jgi:hypothetical protein
LKIKLKVFFKLWFFVFVFATLWVSNKYKKIKVNW